jgi:hypothetical protein
MSWLPGQSGNPEGGRAGKPIRDAIRLELAMMEQGREDPIPALCARAMVRAQIRKAVKGDTAAFNAIADRSDGKPKVTFTGDDEDPIQISVTRGDESRQKIMAELERIASRQVAIEVVADEGSEQP